MQQVKLYRSAFHAARSLAGSSPTVLFHGDCMDLIRQMPDNSVDVTIASPPYCMGMEYDTSRSLNDFIGAQRVVLPEVVRITKHGGSICWQVGYYVKNSELYPLDYEVLSIMRGVEGIALRNRIIWTFGHGAHGRNRFSGRHEMIMWFTKGAGYAFNLDAVRVPQKYPGKRVYSGPRKGEYSGNPLGTNPSDVWAIPNVKAKHVEKLQHPCQFPVGLADRLVRALSPSGGLIFDPYMGSASTGVAAIINERRFVGAEIAGDYISVARMRLAQAYCGTVPYRPADKPIFVPGPGLAAAKRPEHFAG